MANWNNAWKGGRADKQPVSQNLLSSLLYIISQRCDETWVDSFFILTSESIKSVRFLYTQTTNTANNYD